MSHSPKHALMKIIKKKQSQRLLVSTKILQEASYSRSRAHRVIKGTPAVMVSLIYVQDIPRNVPKRDRLSSQPNLSGAAPLIPNPHIPVVRQPYQDPELG
jgi:hypothetical protein